MQLWLVEGRQLGSILLYNPCKVGVSRGDSEHFFSRGSLQNATSVNNRCTRRSGNSSVSIFLAYRICNSLGNLDQYNLGPLDQYTLLPTVWTRRRMMKKSARDYVSAIVVERIPTELAKLIPLARTSPLRKY